MLVVFNKPLATAPFVIIKTVSLACSYIRNDSVGHFETSGHIALTIENKYVVRACLRFVSVLACLADMVPVDKGLHL